MQFGTQKRKKFTTFFNKKMWILSIKKSDKKITWIKRINYVKRDLRALSIAQKTIPPN